MCVVEKEIGLFLFIILVILCSKMLDLLFEISEGVVWVNGFRFFMLE